MEIVLRVVLGIVLAGAALAKLASPRASIAALASFGFGDGALRPIAWAALIAVELALAVAVALGSDAAAYAAAALMALFAALTVGALLRGRAGAPCACFGPRSTVSWLGVLRNLVLAAGFALIPSIDSISIEHPGLAWHRDRRGARRLRRPRGRGARARPRGRACCASSSARRARSRSRARVRRSAHGRVAGLSARASGRTATARPRRLHLRGLRDLPDPLAGDRERGQATRGSRWRLRRGRGGGALARARDPRQPLRARARSRGHRAGQGDVQQPGAARERAGDGGSGEGPLPVGA